MRSVVVKLPAFLVTALNLALFIGILINKQKKQRLIVIFRKDEMLQEFVFQPTTELNRVPRICARHFVGINSVCSFLLYTYMEHFLARKM